MYSQVYFILTYLFQYVAIQNTLMGSPTFYFKWAKKLTVKVLNIRWDL